MSNSLENGHRRHIRLEGSSLKSKARAIVLGGTSILAVVTPFWPGVAGADGPATSHIEPTGPPIPVLVGPSPVGAEVQSTPSVPSNRPSESRVASQTDENKNVYESIPQALINNHPELAGLKATIVEIEGKKIEGTVADGPKVYKFRAGNGQRIETLARELDRLSYVRSDLYDEFGGTVVFDMDTRISKTLLRNGNYYLAISPNGNAPGGRFELSVRDPYEHGVQTTFFMNPNGSNEEEVRYDPEMLPIFNSEKLGVVLNIHPDASYYTQEEVYNPDKISRKDIKVFVLSGTPDQLSNGTADFPEQNPYCTVEYALESRWYSDDTGRNTRLVQEIITYHDPITGGSFPKGSHVVVALRNPKTGNFDSFSRFFISN